MKVSSFYKQSGVATFLVQNEYDLNFRYDKLYIFREQEDTPMPKIKIITDPNTVLMGSGFRFISQNVVSDIIAKCRPDYLLYDYKDSNLFKNTTFVQLFGEEGAFLGRIQEPKNTGDKRTIVVDKCFWDGSDDDVVAALQMLNTYKNISFDAAIPLERLCVAAIMSEFLRLNLNKTIKHTFKITKKEEKNISEVFNVIKILQENAIIIKKIQTTFSNIDLTSQEKFDKIFHYNMELLAFTKINRINLHFTIDGSVNHWGYYPVAAHFLWWTNSKTFTSSLLESMTSLATLETGLPWYTILNDTKYWKGKVCLLLELLTHNKIDCMEYGIVKWWREKNGKQLINWKNIKKYDFKYYFIERN